MTHAARPAAIFFFIVSPGAYGMAQECPVEVPLRPWAEPATTSGTAGASAVTPPRVARIDFVGNRAVSGGRLRRAMVTRRERPRRSGDATRWDPEQWEEDHRRLCAVLREDGYVTARVGPPQAAEVEAGGASTPGGVGLTIPVAEGPRYRMGDLALEGLSLVSADEARAFFEVTAGEWYAEAPVAAGLEALRRRYAARGYAEWTATTVLRPDAARQVVDVFVRVQEGQPRFAGRISFTGHRGTLDRTLRREVLLDEGDLLDTERLRASIERIESLGFVTVRDVRLSPNARDPQALDITFTVEPRPILRYGLAGGVSGLEGVSVTGQLGTVNLFGRGERVLGSVQLGEDVTAFDFAASRPYVLGTRWTLGVQVQKERLDLDAVPGGALPAYTRDEGAFRVQAQRAIGRRAGLWLGYSLATVTLEAEPGVTPPPGFGRRRESEVAATYRFDGWDHPWKPSRGVRATGFGQWAGGTVDYLKARARTFALAPLGRRAALGAGAEMGWLRPLGSGEVLPFDERLLLGGESDLRGFDVRSVGPRDAAGALTGGTRSLALQGEAHLDVSSWLRAVAFVDVGHAWEAGGWPGWRDLLLSTGGEVRFALPVFRLPVRLIYAYNLARDEVHRRTKFRVAIGPLP